MSNETNALAERPEDWYLEDYTEALANETQLTGGRYVVTEEEILEFGRRFDPQPFHTDPIAAKDGPFGGLVRYFGHRPATAAPQVISDRPNGQGKVRPRVSVRDRKHVDPIQLGPLTLRVLTCSDQGAPETRPVEIGDLGRAQTELLGYEPFGDAGGLSP